MKVEVEVGVHNIRSRFTPRLCVYTSTGYDLQIKLFTNQIHHFVNQIYLFLQIKFFYKHLLHIYTFFRDYLEVIDDNLEELWVSFENISPHENQQVRDLVHQTWHTDILYFFTN